MDIFLGMALGIDYNEGVGEKEKIFLKILKFDPLVPIIKYKRLFFLFAIAYSVLPLGKWGLFQELLAIKMQKIRLKGKRK